MKLIPLASNQFIPLNHLATNILTSGIRLIPRCEGCFWVVEIQYFPKPVYLVYD